MAPSLLPPPGSTPLERTSPKSAETVVAAITRAVGTVTDESPLDLAPLGEAVDTDAVEAVVSPRHESGHIAFEYLGYAVVVHADGEIVVYGDP